MIKWFLPIWSIVESEDRLNAMHFLRNIAHSEIVVVYPDGRYYDILATEYMVLLFAWEQSNRRSTQKKLDELQKRFIEMSKELSSLKKNKIAS